jgi:hypothetical protein
VKLDLVSRVAVYLKNIPNSSVIINKEFGNVGQCFYLRSAKPVGVSELLHVLKVFARTERRSRISG